MTENGEKLAIVKCKYLRVGKHLTATKKDLVCVMGYAPGPQKCVTRFACVHGRYNKIKPGEEK